MPRHPLSNLTLARPNLARPPSIFTDARPNSARPLSLPIALPSATESSPLPPIPNIRVFRAQAKMNCGHDELGRASVKIDSGRAEAARARVKIAFHLYR